MDSVGVPIVNRWDDLRIGILLLDPKPKPLSSRAGMQATVLTSPFYSAWPAKQQADLFAIQTAIEEQDFIKLGERSESNALAMHALMMTADPAIIYSTPQTLAAQQFIWQQRSNGLSLYFTQDAGPNLKLLFLAPDIERVSSLFPDLLLISPFQKKEEK